MRGTLPFRLCSLALALTMVMVLVMVAPVGPAHGDDDDPPAPPPKGELTYPNLGSHLSGLADSYEQGRASQQESAGQAAISQGGSVAVTIYLTANVSDVVQFLWDNGGDPRNVGEDYIEAYVPVSLLGSLSEQPGVIRVREIIPPMPEFGPITSQGVAAHLATAWHTAGFTGQDVKVGIIDLGFEGIRSLMGSELPATVERRAIPALVSTAPTWPPATAMALTERPLRKLSLTLRPVSHYISPIPFHFPTRLLQYGGWLTKESLSSTGRRA